MKTKRIYSVLLTLVLIFSLLLSFTLTTSAAEVVETGNCGTGSYNVTYTLDKEGTLTISGFGDIKASAFKGRAEIKKVIIGSSVNNTNSSVFENCTNLASIEIAYNTGTPSGMAIYSYAFANTAITSIDLPSSVKTINYGAFENCAMLETVNYYGVPESNHNANAFYNCKKLTSVNVQPYYTGATFCGKTAVGGTVKTTDSTVVEAIWGESETTLNNSGTFEEAVAAAIAADSTVKYIKLQTDLFPVYETNSTIQGYYKISSGKFTIDLNGKNIFFGNNGYTFYIYNSGTEITFVDSADVDGTVYAAYYSGFAPINVKSGGSVIFRGGNFEGGYAMNIYSAASETEKCKVVVYDGKFTTNPHFRDSVCINNQGGEFIVYGGVFTSNQKNTYYGWSNAIATISGGEFSSAENSDFYVNASKLDLSNYSNINSVTVSNGATTALIPGEDTILLPDGYGFCNNNKFYDELENGVIYSVNKIPEYKYNIVTQANKGSVSTDVSTAVFGTEIALTFAPDENCEFVSVTVMDSFGNIIDVKDNKFIMPASDVTINAVFGDKDKVFTITLDATYGECSVNSIPTTEDGVLASALPTPTATDTIEQGYWFKGWYDAEGGEIEITDTTVFTQDTTIYAQWNIVKPEIVSWDSEVVKFTWAKSDTTPMIILADYDGDRLANIKIMQYTKTSKTEVGKTAAWGTTEITLGKGDKIMIWENFTTCKPLCEAYIVTGNEEVEYEDDNPGIDLPIVPNN